MTLPPLASERTLVIAAVSVVLPWSTLVANQCYHVEISSCRELTGQLSLGKGPHQTCHDLTVADPHSPMFKCGLALLKLA